MANRLSRGVNCCSGDQLANNDDNFYRNTQEHWAKQCIVFEKTEATCEEDKIHSIPTLRIGARIPRKPLSCSQEKRRNLQETGHSLGNDTGEN